MELPLSILNWIWHHCVIDLLYVIFRWKPLLCPQQILSVYLMWETQKGAASEWHPYIQTLPGSFTTPAYFTDTDLQLLPTAVFQRAVQLNQKLCVFYQQIIDFSDTYWPESVEIFTFEAFRRAWYTVNSRSVYMEIGKSEFVRGVENNLALAPFLDLLNHSTQAQVNVCIVLILHLHYQMTRVSVPLLLQTCLGNCSYLNVRLVKHVMTQI